MEYLLVILVFIFPISFSNLLYDSFELLKVAILQIFTFFILAILFLKILKEEKIKIKLTEYNFPVLLFLFSLFIWCIFSSDLKTSFSGEYMKRLGFINILNIILIYYILLNFLEGYATIEKILYSILFSSIIISLYSIFQFFRGETVSSTLGNSSTVAGFLITSLPISLRIYFTSTFLNILSLIGFILFFLATGLTFSKIAIFSFLISFLLCSLFIYRIKKFRKKFYILLFFLLASFLILIFQHINTGETKISFTKKVFSLSNLESEKMKTIYKITLRMIKKRIFIGYGPENITYKFSQYKKREEAEILKKSSIEGVVGEFLNTGIILGIIGIIFYIILVMNIFQNTYYAFKEEKITSYFLHISLIGYLIFYQFRAPSLTTFFLFWVILGISCLFKKRKEIYLDIQREYFYIFIPVFLILSFFFLKNTFSEVIADIYFKKGMENLNRKDFDEAINNFKKSISIYERDIYYFSLGNCYEKRVRKKANVEDGKNAERYYLKAIFLNRENPQYYQTLADYYFYLSNIYSPNFLNYAIKMYKEVLKREPYESKVYINLAKCYMGLKDFKSAEENLKKAEEIDSKNPQIYINMGNLSYYQNKLDKAISYYKYSLKFKFADLNEILVNMGVCYIKKGEIEEGIETLKEVFNFNPKNASAHYNLGYAYYLKGDYYEALKEFEKAMFLDPNLFTIDSLYYKAEIYYKIKEYEKAKKELEKILKINKNHLKANQLLLKIFKQ